ncbi:MULTISPECIES: FUSC family protein [unclassified Curtobacterium]|uniref:FUSC family protein n=1 Tax=unclassified Curtobacterium TaxID=257496 RepID=UPI0015E8C171|nr:MULTISPECIES: FUSC family protein [unclassified Curtobacterium]WIE79193.1 FUSC family protein [Curtobacterium sp. MCSS17_016]
MIRDSRLRFGEALPSPRELLHLHPHAAAHHPALRLGLSAVVPVVALELLGEVTLAPFAILGAVVAVFARRASPWARLHTQVLVAIVQVGLIVVATALAASSPMPFEIVVWTAVVAGASALLADAMGWSPPGNLFFVFSFGACASLPHQAALPLSAAMVAGASAAWTLVVSALWAAFERSSAVGLAAPTAGLAAHPRRWLLSGTHAAMCLVACASAGGAALLLGFDRPYWAMVAAIVPIVGTTTSGQLLRAGHRVVGTIAGVVVAGAVFWFAPPRPLIALILVALTVGTELFVARNYSIALLFLTPVTIGIAFVSGTPALLPLLFTRTAETLLGVAVSIALILASHPVRHPLRASSHRHDEQLRRPPSASSS